eukprot:scaffold2544_cov245-Pinguiococcus_pyrenoidosus.AAC.7
MQKYRRTTPLSGAQRRGISLLVDLPPKRSHGMTGFATYWNPRKESEALHKEVLQARYVQERAEELTARLIGYTNPAATKGNKMRAFYESNYGSDEVSSRMVSLVRHARLYALTIAQDLDAAKDRAEAVREMVAKAAEDKRHDRGLLRVQDDEGNWTTTLPETNAGRAMRLYFKDELQQRAREVGVLLVLSASTAR